MITETNDTDRFDKRLWRAAMISFVQLLVVQGALLLPQFRTMLAAPAAGQSAIQNPSAVKQAPQVTIQLEGGAPLPAPAKVCINGVQVGNFSGVSYTLAVNANDVITVDTSQSPGIYEFTIDENNSAIISPIANQQFDSSIYHPATIGPFLLEQ